MFTSIKVIYLHISSPAGYLQLDFPTAAMLLRKRCPPTLHMGWLLLIWSQARHCAQPGTSIYFFSACLEHRLGAQCPDFAPRWQALSRLSGCVSHPVPTAEQWRSLPGQTELWGERLPTPASSASKNHLTWGCGRHRKGSVGATCLCSAGDLKCTCVSGRASFFKKAIKPLWFFFLGCVGLAQGEKTMV